LSNKFIIKEKVWRYPGPAGWFFVKIGKKNSDEVKFVWGYVRVEARMGSSCWTTTLFPTKEKGYLLAIKSAIRKSENIDEGDVVTIEFSLILEEAGIHPKPAAHKTGSKR
jgi:hypothetical protein